ncbi:hypothetical protein FD754_016611 [Muntiacus muntjak]|uniref:Transcription cofactor vestigial-like protein 1 n=1 Tax=Muntiacus muntjak TaxID=9888 RepID=A0A5N3VRI2_MUNMU|nr:hypothetical protein FD754_016611 [Muntiacus muntjak]
MEDVMKTTVLTQSPIKTEWNSRCVLFTYFQGDISSVVGEHFSRALGNWRFSAPWTKPQPEVSFANGATSCNLNGSGLTPMAQYPLSLTGGPSIQPGELWHFSSLASPSFPEPGYPRAFSTGHLVPEPQPEGKYEPLLRLLQPERCHPQESASWEDGNSAQKARSTGFLFSLPPSSAHFKKIYFPPDGGPAGASFAVERSPSPERRNLFFY